MSIAAFPDACGILRGTNEAALIPVLIVPELHIVTRDCRLEHRVAHTHIQLIHALKRSPDNIAPLPGLED
jgi:hypothetical protein